MLPQLIGCDTPPKIIALIWPYSLADDKIEIVIDRYAILSWSKLVTFIKE